ncbi:hypothetical protein Trydic_g3057 [Trypoxylus dichotomus]
MISQEIQTDPISKRNKPDAPYNLVISGQPNVLNNIVFIEMDGDIVIKQHTEKPWKPLTAAEFLNYPFVYVILKLPDFELSRSNLHEFQRYITECGDSVSCPEVDFVTYIKKRNQTMKPTVFSFDYIHAYCKQFLETIKKVKGINIVKITELEELFRQFLFDIEESDVFSSVNEAGKTVNTMATDTTVCFHIGRKTYVRNKKMIISNENQKESNAVNFCEILIPRMAYTLTKLVDSEDTSTEDTSFKNLNDINDQITKKSPEIYKFIEAVNNSVSYHCILCPKMYAGEQAYIEILDHYRFLHKSEQSVLCFMCRKQFAIAKLAGCRWSHECSEEVATTSSCTSDLKPTPPTTNTTIGITDILSSGKSTISFDDLISKQSTAAAEPANNIVNVTTNAPVTNTVINTLPVVRVSTSTAIMSAGGVLFAIATPPVRTYSSVRATPPVRTTPAVRTTPPIRISPPVRVAPVPIAPKPAPMSPVSLSSLSMPNEDVSAAAATSIQPSASTSMNMNENEDFIKTEIEEEFENINEDDFLLMPNSMTSTVETPSTTTSSIMLTLPAATLTSIAPVQTSPLIMATIFPDAVPAAIEPMHVDPENVVPSSMSIEGTL